MKVAIIVIGILVIIIGLLIWLLYHFFIGWKSVSNDYLELKEIIEEIDHKYFAIINAIEKYVDFGAQELKVEILKILAE